MTVRIEYGGTYQEQQQSFHELLRVLILSLALVFGVLLAEFRNFSAPIAILTSSVLSIAGVVLALLVTRTTFNVASFMGLIMVIGIVAKNGILLLDADERYRHEGGSARDAMVHAAQRRLRPILMTAIGRNLRHVAASVRAWLGIADAATACHRGHRRACNLDDLESDCDASNLLLAHPFAPPGGIKKSCNRVSPHSAQCSGASPSAGGCIYCGTSTTLVNELIARLQGLTPAHRRG